MNPLLIVLFICFCFVSVKSQKLEVMAIPDEYFIYVNKADSFFKIKNYKKSAEYYSKAFVSCNNIGFPKHKYRAARSWALGNNLDSAFYYLNQLAFEGEFADYESLNLDTNFKILHDDKRWLKIINQVSIKKAVKEKKFIKPLADGLDSVYETDQKYRSEIDEIAKKYGWGSKEIQAQWQIINHFDSINLIKIRGILDKYGWLGVDEIGGKGNMTLYLVIQHSDLEIQEKYLPLMREAVKNGNAKSGQLALLEDRVALRKGKRQIYGSQIGQNRTTNLYYVSPLENPENVDKRRAEVGLGSLADYVKKWKIVWDVNQYKIDLPELEEMIKLEESK